MKKRYGIYLSLILLLVSCFQDHEIVLPKTKEEAATMLDSILEEDQKYRLQIPEIEKEFGSESTEMKEHNDLIARTDSANLIVVKYIIETYGWLGPKDVGYNANSAIFLVIQHADIKTQENYIPTMREAVSEGNARSGQLALLEDRVAIANGELQIYGSQVGIYEKTGEYYVLPLFEPEKVNERRHSVGLDSIETYLSTWNINWNVNEYYEKLPIWIEEQRKFFIKK